MNLSLSKIQINMTYISFLKKCIITLEQRSAEPKLHNGSDMRWRKNTNFLISHLLWLLKHQGQECAICTLQMFEDQLFIYIQSTRVFNSCSLQNWNKLMFEKCLSLQLFPSSFSLGQSQFLVFSLYNFFPPPLFFFHLHIYFLAY